MHVTVVSLPGRYKCIVQRTGWDTREDKRMAEDFKQKVEQFKEAIKQERWNDISSQVWGDKQNQLALSVAARSGAEAGLPAVEFKKNDKNELVIEFSRPGVTGWLKDHL